MIAGLCFIEIFSKAITFENNIIIWIGYFLINKIINKLNL